MSGDARDPAWSHVGNLTRRGFGRRVAVAVYPFAYPFACTFAHVSLSVIVRLNTGTPGRESVSTQK